VRHTKFIALRTSRLRHAVAGVEKVEYYSYSDVEKCGRERGLQAPVKNQLLYLMAKSHLGDL